MTEENLAKLHHLASRAQKRFRGIFIERWKVTQGTDWDDTKDFGDYFATNQERQILELMKTPQVKGKLQEGKSGDWDLTTLGKILNSKPFSQPTFTAPINRVLEERNKISHQSTEFFNSKEYKLCWDNLCKALIELGDSKDELEELEILDIKLIDEMSKNELQEKLKNSGNEKFQRGDYDEALKDYSDALLLHDLSDKEKAILFAKLGSCNLKIYQKKKTKENEVEFGIEESILKLKNNPELLKAMNMKGFEISEALTNFKRSIELYPTWTKPYFEIGLIYEMIEQLERAKKYFEKVKDLDNEHKEVDSHLLSIKEKMCSKMKEHFDSRILPEIIGNPLEEYLNEKTKDGNVTLTIDQVMKCLLENHPGQIDVQNGHSKRDEHDNEFAARYYGKGVSKENPEAMYNLALLTEQGKGVKRELNLVLSYLEGAVSQPPTLKILGHDFPNIGVAEAEYALGNLYFEGIQVKRDYKIAADWYEKAVAHGSGLAANKLGFMYMGDQGIFPPNLTKAKKLLLLAHSKNDKYSIRNLMILSLKMYDPEKALFWFNESVKNDFQFSNTRSQEIQSLINQMIQEFEETGIPKWENEVSFSSENLNHLERSKRYFERKEGAIILSKVNKLIEPRKISLEIVYEQVLKGSQTACQLYQALGYIYLAIEIRGKDLDKFITFMSKACRYESLFIGQILVDLKALADINKVISKSKSGMCQLNQDARICYLFYQKEGDATIQFITKAIRSYPKSWKLFEQRAIFNKKMKKYDLALNDLNESLNLEPKNLNLLFLKGEILLSLNNEIEAVETFQNFVSLAPVCNQSVPYAYYYIASHDLNLQKVDQVESYYQKGLQSEKDQLPFFLPVTSNSKEEVEKFLQTIPKINTSSSQSSSIVDSNESQLPLEPELGDPLRFQVLLQHRATIKKMKDSYQPTNNPPKTQASFIGLEQLTLRSIDKTKAQPLNGVLTVTNVDMVCIGGSSIQFVIKDVKHEIIRMSVYNLKKTPEDIRKIYKIGCEMEIVNPYLELVDGYPRIVVHDPKKYLMVLGQFEKMCRFCFKECSKELKCPECKVAIYCSKECQLNDKKLAGHQDICTIRK